jgi:hypothetical protein
MRFSLSGGGGGGGGRSGGTALLVTKQQVGSRFESLRWIYDCRPSRDHIVVF